MNVEVVIEENIPEQDEYVVREVNGRFTITTTLMSDESSLKRWVNRVRKIYRHKLQTRTLVIGLCADRSVNYANGTWYFQRKKVSELPYELLQMCVGTHCLLGRMVGGMKLNPRVLKDLLHEGRATVVGVGIEKILAKLAEDNGWVVPTRVVELGDVAVAVAGDEELKRLGVGKLSGEVLGDEMRFEKPAKIKWTHNPYSFTRDLTDDMLKYASVEAYLASQMGEKLLFPTNKTKQMDKRSTAHNIHIDMHI